MFETVKKERKESEPLEKIKLKHLVIAFLILGVGSLVAFVAFLLEMIGGKKLQEAQKDSDTENQNMESYSSD